MNATSPDQSAPRRAYRPDIDGLRAVAIALVVINHYFKDLLPGGFIGVDVFFVISGFLITGIVYDELKKDTFSILKFYRRRVLRLFPALIAMLFGILLLGLIVLSPDELELLGKHMVASAFFVINFSLVHENGYFDLASDLKPLLHMWSLAVEEQFYLVWPILLYIAVRFRLAMFVLFSTTVVSLWLNLYYIDSASVTVFFSPQFRAWEFGVGGLIALWNRSEAPTYNNHQTLLADFVTLAGLVLILASASLLDAHSLYPGWRAMLPVAGAGLVLAFGASSKIALIALGNPVTVYLGRISYPLYLWHWPLISLLTMAMGPPDDVIRVLAMVTALLLAVLTYHLIERPVQRLPGQLGNRDFRTSALSAIVAALAISGLGLYLADGLPRRVVGYQPLEASSYNYIDEGCRALAGERFNYCRLSSTDRPPSVALLGDSHANHFFEGVAEYSSRFGETVINLGGCLPLPDTAIYQEGTVDGCVDLGAAQLDFVLKSPSIHTIIVAGRMAYWVSGAGVNGLENGRTRYVMQRDVNGEILYGRDAFHSGLNALIEKVESHSKRLVFILDNPELDFPPASCVSQRPFDLFKREKCAIPRAAVERRQSAYRSVVSNLANYHPSMTVFDPMDAMCDQEYCHALFGSKLLYRDDNHLSVDGSIFLASHYDFLHVKW